MINLNYLLIFLSLLVFVSCNNRSCSSVQQQRKESVEALSEITDKTLTCDEDRLSKENDQAVRKLIDSVHKLLDTDFCGEPYMQGCDKGPILYDCNILLPNVREYLNNNKKKLTICRAYGEAKAAVDTKNRPNHIFLFDKFFQQGKVNPNDPDAIRTLVHELTHLAGEITPHTNIRDCDYFSHAALKAEHCLTCHANIVAPELIKCANGKNGIFITY